MATNKTDFHHAPLSGSDDSSVKRILTHVDRLLAFSKVEWFLHEQSKDTILKLDFIQDRKYTNVFQTSDSLPRVKDHISRLTLSHKLKEWSLREREESASIIIAFQYDNTHSDETLFFLNTEHLKLVADLNEHKDSHKEHFSDTLSIECHCKCNPCMSDNKHGRILTETYSTPLVSTQKPHSHCAPGRGTVPSQSETDTLLLTPSAISPVKERTQTSVKRSDIRERQLPQRDNKTSSKTPAPKPHQSTVASSTTKRRDVKSESENTSKSSKNKFPSVIRKNAATKKPPNTKNPFSVTGATANQNNANRKTKFSHTGNSRRPLQRSKSISAISKPSDITPGNGRTISATSQAEPELAAAKFTFSKEYRKLKPESKLPAVNLGNPSVKRKHERADHYTDEDHIPDPNSLKPEVPKQRMATNESAASEKGSSKEMVLTSSNHPQNILHGKGSYPFSSGEHGSPIGDLYRLYFADSADISMFNNDVFWSSTDRTHNSKSSMADMPHCSTPSVKPPGGQGGVLGELAKKFFSNTTESRIDPKATRDFSKCQDNTSQTHSGVISPRKGGSESLSETASSTDDSQQDTTITEASQTDCDMFSCCTEPCLDVSVKEEIQEYFVKIYNQVQSEPRVETAQLLWQINEEGRICLYHKYLNQVKKHDLVSPEELQDLERNGSHSVMPRSIRHQYIFRRLLEELDQVTFDNRPLTDAEKRRLDNFMTSAAGCS